MKRTPGELYYLPPEEGSHDPREDRPHILLAPEQEDPAVFTFAFGSTQDLEAHQGAPHVQVLKGSPLFKATGLSESTYLYPSRLICALADDIAQGPAGRVIDEFPALRDTELPNAVGIGWGTAAERGPAFGSVRGMIARFSATYAEDLSTPYGVIVTYPPYSKKGMVQNFIPIYDAVQYPLRLPHCVELHGPWAAQMPDIQQPVFMIPFVQSAYQRDDIQGFLPVALDGAAMTRIDEELSAYLLKEPVYKPR